MPTCEYKCNNCGYNFEEFQSMKDDKLTVCPKCKKETLVRLIGTGEGLIFKGSGFYLTDYRNTSGSKTESEIKKEPKSSDGAISSDKPKTPSAPAAEKTSKKISNDPDTKTSKDIKEIVTKTAVYIFD